MRRICLLMTATLLALLERAAAQEPGDRVRLTIESPASRHLVGTFVREHADSLWVELPGHPALVAAARNATARLEVSRGRHRATIRGAVIGAGLGAIGGFVVSGVGTTQSQPCGSAAFVGACVTDWYGRAFRGGLIGATVGGAIGAVLGSIVTTERWARVPLHHTPHLTLAPRGAGLALSLMF
jgi:hypothetical protein